MIRSALGRFLSVALIAAAVAVASCNHETPNYAALGNDAAALRTQFNKDAGRVRLVMLVAPT